MQKLGLKLYSTNDYYFAEAAAMYAEGFCDFIEVLPVPGSFDSTIAGLKALNAPFIIHAPHFSFGVNLGSREAFDGNMKIIHETLKFADTLKARHIICHPGIASDIDETARQLRVINDPRLLVENKPYETTDGRLRCIGGSVEEIAMVMRESRVGFCMDICHGASYAVNIGRDWYEYLKAFSALKPAMFHLSDGDIASGKDTHDHICSGNYDWARILPLLPADATITIETKKDSQRDLADFRRDVSAYRALLNRFFGSAAALSIRLARMDDVEKVFSLSNDPAVRRYSIKREPIKWEDHLSWFASKIKDKDSDFFVVEAGNDFVAQVRYHKDDVDFVVSLSITGNFRGRGLAAAILRESSRRVFAARAQLPRIVAYIDPDNVTSERTFKRAGYSLEGTVMVGTRPFGRYILDRTVICG